MVTDDRSGTCPLKLLRPRTLAAVAGGLSALAAWLLVVALAWPDLNPLRQPTPFEELVAAVGTNRTVKGRLTGGFQYGPVASPVRGRASGGTAGDDFRLLAAISRVQHASKEGPTPENLHAFGVALLLADDLNRAVAALHDTVNARSEARALSDLAAAYLERAVRFDRAEDLPQALALAERAITADGRLVEAWFNRAVALEELALPNRARHAWADYVQRDGRSEWTREARSRLSALEGVPGSPVADLIASVLGDASPSSVRDLVTLDAQAARELVEDSLLPRWAASVLSGRTSEAAQALAVAQLVSGRLGEMTGDFLTARVVAAAARAPADRLTALAEGHVLWRAAREAYHRNDPAQFGPLFGRAQSRFEHAGSPMSLWAAHYGAVRLYFDGHVDTGVCVVSRLLRVSAAERSNALTARLQWDLG
ncbi:MAG: hypothetical protein ACRD26_18605, partial [Vicinamibacterales bacterium]